MGSAIAGHAMTPLPPSDVFLTVTVMSVIFLIEVAFSL